jgi:hypothetical protein
MNMIYRIAIKSKQFKVYYLSNNENPTSIDGDLQLDDISFLSTPSLEYTYAYSTKELSQNAIEQLPFPYNEKVSIVEFDDINSKLFATTYYRVIKETVFNSTNKRLWAASDKKFYDRISDKTCMFISLEEAINYKNSLSKLYKNTSHIIEVLDYGPPKYEFDFSYLKLEDGKYVKTEKIS